MRTVVSGSESLWSEVNAVQQPAHKSVCPPFLAMDRCPICEQLASSLSTRALIHSHAAGGQQHRNLEPQSVLEVIQQRVKVA
mmetsp:Transcript_9865/g.23511  ORF Transcript_9865/g.23511 Transcript_9865/m.23511 type:complete len:82 (+) Transcript_9865:613-858(+)